MDDERGARSWAIGELAAATGVSVRSLRHYDRIGLLVPSGRTAAGHRRYTDVELRRLHQLVVLRGFGLSLEGSRHVLDGGVELVVLLRRQAEQAAEHLAATVRLQRTLSDVLTRLDAVAEPTPDDLITLLEEMTAVHRPLTPQELAEMTRRRAEHAAALTPQERATMAEQRRAAWEAMTEDERAELAASRAAALPPGWADRPTG